MASSRGTGGNSSSNNVVIVASIGRSSREHQKRRKEKKASQAKKGKAKCLAKCMYDTITFGDVCVLLWLLKHFCHLFSSVSSPSLCS